MITFRATFLLLFAQLLYAPAMSQQQEETLSIQPPAAWGGWKQASRQRAPDGTELVAWVPSNEDTVAWNEAITIFTFQSRPPGDVTTNVIRHTMAQLNAACLKMSIGPPAPRTEGPFTIAYAQAYCTERRDTTRGRIDVIKAIASEHRVYLVVVMKNVKPFQIGAVPGALTFSDDEAVPIFDWLKETQAYLASGVRVCIGPAEKREVCSS